MPTLIQSRSATNGGTTISLTLNDPINEGEFVVICQASFAPPPTENFVIDFPAGYTIAIQEHTEAAGAGMSILIGWKFAGAGETNFFQTNKTDSSAANYLWVGVYSGVPDTVALDTATSIAGDNTNVTSHSTGTTSALTQVNNFVVAVWGIGGTHTAPSYTNNFSEVVVNGDLAVATKTVASLASVECTRSWTGAYWAAGAIAVFRLLAGPLPSSSTIAVGVIESAQIKNLSLGLPIKLIEDEFIQGEGSASSTFLLGIDEDAELFSTITLATSFSLGWTEDIFLSKIISANETNSLGLIDTETLTKIFTPSYSLSVGAQDDRTVWVNVRAGVG